MSMELLKALLCFTGVIIGMVILYHLMKDDLEK